MAFDFSRLKAAKASNTKLVEQNKALAERNRSLMEALSTTSEALTEATEGLEGASDALEESETEVAKLEAEATSAEDRALETVASLGVDADVLPDGTHDEGSPAALFAEYESLMKSDPMKAAEFWARHEEKFLAAAE